MKNEEIIVTKLNIEDLQELKEISQQTFLDTYSWANTFENMQEYLDAHFNEEILRQTLQEPNSEFYFAKGEAERKSEAFGYLKINFGAAQTDLKKENAIEIERIYVKKEFQGKRIGQKLIHKALEIANMRDVSFIWLGVWDKNQKAIAFYEKNGFVNSTTHDFQLGDEIQRDYVMKLMLN